MENDPSASFDKTADNSDKSYYLKVSKVLHLNVEVLEILDPPGTRVEMTDQKKKPLSARDSKEPQHEF